MSKSTYYARVKQLAADVTAVIGDGAIDSTLYTTGTNTWAAYTAAVSLASIGYFLIDLDGTVRRVPMYEES